MAEQWEMENKLDAAVRPVNTTIMVSLFLFLRLSFYTLLSRDTFQTDEMVTAIELEPMNWQFVSLLLRIHLRNHKVRCFSHIFTAQVCNS